MNLVDWLQTFCMACGEGQLAASEQQLTCDNEDPGEPDGQTLLHFIVEVTGEGCL